MSNTWKVSGDFKKNIDSGAELVKILICENTDPNAKLHSLSLCGYENNIIRLLVIVHNNYDLKSNKPLVDNLILLSMIVMDNHSFKIPIVQTQDIVASLNVLQQHFQIPINVKNALCNAMNCSDAK